MVRRKYQPFTNVAAGRQQRKHSFHVPGANLLPEPRLPAKTSTAAVLCNRFLVESGLLDRDPTLILSAAYDKFKTKLVTPSGKGLTKAGRSLLSDISWKSGMSARHRDVANGLQMLIHQLSSVAHLVNCVTNLPTLAACL